jgi:hypothetical protein
MKQNFADDMVDFVNVLDSIIENKIIWKASTNVAKILEKPNVWTWAYTVNDEIKGE